MDGMPVLLSSSSDEELPDTSLLLNSTPRARIHRTAEKHQVHSSDVCEPYRRHTLSSPWRDADPEAPKEQPDEGGSDGDNDICSLLDRSLHITSEQNDHSTRRAATEEHGDASEISVVFQQRRRRRQLQPSADDKKKHGTYRRRNVIYDSDEDGSGSDAVTDDILPPDICPTPAFYTPRQHTEQHERPSTATSAPSTADDPPFYTPNTTPSKDRGASSNARTPLSTENERAIEQRSNTIVLSDDNSDNEVKKDEHGHIQPDPYIRLVEKVIDNADRLAEVLMHEMTHAATFVINRTCKAHHGPIFRAWCKRINIVYPDLKTSRTHNFDINYKYQWRCTNTECHTIVGRHSKSLDTTRKVCGKCYSRFEQIQPPPKPAIVDG
ncbi:SprT-like family-domain-containing protein [Syncephalis pseudoplumigaleata]|uniref:SprT-like family-domain-containing protein n=1 Tax=Syncephalis pseudoplumigaleata TaxID=1712513 RepID=A0A4P9Z2S3_9FUNG|nr:SprT-like family-domain-containing protein [Syncephalis pseudoplumigaleata]|eukprot:RKP26675.1 SprT-like family-domain-containing protein [Syncephalis pseudoplumigaleata]